MVKDLFQTTGIVVILLSLWFIIPFFIITGFIAIISILIYLTVKEHNASLRAQEYNDTDDP